SSSPLLSSLSLSLSLSPSLFPSLSPSIPLSFPLSLPPSIPPSLFPSLHPSLPLSPSHDFSSTLVLTASSSVSHLTDILDSTIHPSPIWGFESPHSTFA